MTQRISLIDALRGFSLLGILIANLLIFQYGSVGKEYIDDLSWIDSISYYFTKIFVETSFMPIFSFIFGYSLIKLFESIKRRQHKTRWLLIRRAIGLIVLGLLHSTFIWEGDILLFYGGLLFILLFFLYRKPKTLFIWSGILFVLTIGLSISENVELFDPEKAAVYVKEEFAVFSSGTYGEVIDFRLNSEMPIAGDELTAAFFAFVIIIVAPIMYLPLFLLGMAFAKLNLFSAPENEQKIYRRMSYLVIVGLVLKAIGQLDFSYSDFFYAIGGPLLALGYVGLFALLYNTQVGRKYSEAFANVGKLSLTNYLMQSVIFTFIFYGYGLGLFGSVGPTIAIVMALAVYAVQVWLSAFYLRHFKRGPVETMLRIWTNWRIKDRPVLQSEHSISGESSYITTNSK